MSDENVEMAEGLAQAAAACQSIALGYEAQAGEWNANAKAYAARECARAIHALRRAALDARASRPREAVVAPEALDKALAKAAHDVWANAHPNGVCGQDVATPYIVALGVALGYGTCYPPAPPVAPEACPVATPLLYSCGCVSCVCEDEDRCHGCGAKSCGKHPGGGPGFVVGPAKSATPASAAGREGAVEKVVEAAKALLKNRGATYSVGTIPPSRYVMIPIAYFDALVAAEAAGREGDK